jgi:nicotinamide-nucleotide amidase
MIDQELIAQATALLALCRGKKLKIATAESCTGGLVAGTLTEIAGSSDVVERGFVTYSNEAKEQMLGVPAVVLTSHGAVSRETAEAMAKGALAHSPAAVAGKPVGLVHFGAASRGGRLVHRERRYGDIGRTQVRRASVVEALAMLRELAEQENVRTA